MIDKLAIEHSLHWLNAALSCQDFRWDSDQREMATMALNAARASLAQPPAAPAVKPDECCATGQGHSYKPCGPRASMQCEWCGESPAVAGEVAMPEPQLFDGVRLSEDGKYGATEDGYTADQLRAYGDARAIERAHGSASPHGNNGAHQMIHARDDYNRIQDPAGKIPDDEPVFLLRAQDQLACMAVAYYATLCEQAQSPEIAAKARRHAERMAAWPTKKVPDLPAAPPSPG